MTHPNLPRRPCPRRWPRSSRTNAPHVRPAGSRRHPRHYPGGPAPDAFCEKVSSSVDNLAVDSLDLTNTCAVGAPGAEKVEEVEGFQHHLRRWDGQDEFFQLRRDGKDFFWAAICDGCGGDVVGDKDKGRPVEL